ncbi:MAG: hypothetical protein HYU36_01395 [Planctomycetes bacterium]|nr:hypothetical protein [Planctomycetota bacterium]
MAQLHDVNTTDLRGAINLGCRTMQSVFNADEDRRVAFFGAQLLPASEFSLSRYHSEAHVTGRHLNALLNAGMRPAFPSKSRRSTCMPRQPSSPTAAPQPSL